jgi:hypothetical protein
MTSVVIRFVLDLAISGRTAWEVVRSHGAY